MIRLPAPWGVGWDWVVREEEGIWQPRARPVVVEKYAVGVFGWLWTAGDGFPGRRMCFGESWKRQEDDDGGALDEGW